jgi:hypothetical protein
MSIVSDASPSNGENPLAPFCLSLTGKRIQREIITPPFGKACLPADRGGWEGFKKVIF